MQIITSKDKEKVRRWARKANRKILWKDTNGLWHAATDKRNTPHAAVETEVINEDNNTR